jgi:hypothetical protein
MKTPLPIDAQSQHGEPRPIRLAGFDPVLALLRAEGLAEFALALWAYYAFGGSWLLFGILFLAPDLSMVGYLINPRIGARLYNLAHTYLAPALLVPAGFMLAIPVLHALALIWAAHIGFDRLLGFGLKYPVAFGATHLSGKGARA